MKAKDHTDRAASLSTLQVETENEHARRLKLWDKDEWFYEPDPAALYVWKLTIIEAVPFSNINKYSYDVLFLTRELAVRFACNRFKERNTSPSGMRFYEEAHKLIDAGRFQEALDWISTSTDTFSCQFAMIEVSARATSTEFRTKSGK